MGTTVRTCCIAVTDVDATVAFYEALGLTSTAPGVVARPGKGGALRLEPAADDTAVDHGSALWKLYVNTNDIGSLHADALAAGATEDMAPMRLEQWPTSVSFVRDRDGYLVELVQRHPWLDGDDATRSWLGQFCVNVTDLDATVAFYEALGLECTSRTSIAGAEEAIVEHSAAGGKLQLAQHDGQASVDMGSAMRAIELSTDDRGAVGVLSDPDGYRVELVAQD